MEEENTQSQQEKNSHAGSLLAGVVAATVAGAIYLYSPKMKKHQQELRGWMLKVKGDIMEQIEDAQHLTQEKYEEMVDRGIEKYADLDRSSRAEINELKDDLKERWEDIRVVALDRAETAADVAKEEIAKRQEEPEV